MSAHPTRRTSDAVTGVVLALGFAAALLFGAPAREVVRKVQADLNPPADNWAFIEAQERSAAVARKACPNSEYVIVDGGAVCLPRKVRK